MNFSLKNLHLPKLKLGRAFLASAALVATAVPAVLAASSVAASAATAVHVSNPYSGATIFLDPDYVDEVQSSYNATVGSNPSLAAQMATVATYPTFHWMDSMATMNGTNGATSLTNELNDALKEQSGSTPIVWQGVVYDLPGRDCAALASNGEIPLTSSGLTEYEQNYINPMAAIMSNPKYSNIRMVLVVEPDSLPNLATNTGQSGGTNTTQCFDALQTGIYEAAYEYAVQTLGAIPNVYLYLDIAHSAWLGWTNNATAGATVMTDMIKGIDLCGAISGGQSCSNQTVPATPVSEGFAAVTGFADDTANYTPLLEPYMTATESNSYTGGQEVESANFYQYNATIDENGFINEERADLQADGWPTSSLNWITDTGRNGWGATNGSLWGNTASPVNVRPTGPDTSASNVNTFVQYSKIDLRDFRGEWCNQANAGLGIPPTVNPSIAGVTAPLQATVWIKPPGESDGSSTAIANTQGKKFDEHCSPTYTDTTASPSPVLTQALPNAPLAGNWFPQQFQMLVQNAYPPVPAYTGSTLPWNEVPLAGNSGTASSGTTTTTAAPTSTTSAPVTTTAAPVTTTAAPVTTTAAPVSTTAAPVTSASATLCNTSGTANNQTAPLAGGKYVLSVDEWDSTAAMCVSTDGGADFTVQSSSIAQSGSQQYTPGAYPDIIAGRHPFGGNPYSANPDGLPLAVSAINSGVVTSWSTTENSNDGTYDVAYDNWFDPSSAPSLPTGEEMMIWLNHNGAQPAGSVVATATLDGIPFNIWASQMTNSSGGHWEDVSFVMANTTSSVTNLQLAPLVQESIKLGYMQSSWYLDAIEAGFEIWQNGTGLATNSFSFSTNGAGAPTTTTAAPTTTTSASDGHCYTTRRSCHRSSCCGNS